MSLTRSKPKGACFSQAQLGRRVNRRRGTTVRPPHGDISDGNPGGRAVRTGASLCGFLCSHSPPVTVCGRRRRNHHRQQRTATMGGGCCSHLFSLRRIHVHRVRVPTLFKYDEYQVKAPGTTIRDDGNTQAPAPTSVGTLFLPCSLQIHDNT